MTAEHVHVIMHKEQFHMGSFHHHESEDIAMNNENKRGKILSISKISNGYDAGSEREDNTFGKRLRDARRAKGLSQREIAEGLRKYNIIIQAPAVTKWETGHSLPNIYQVFALCRLLDIEDGIRFFSGSLHPEEHALNETGLKKVQAYREDLEASGLYSFKEPDYDAEEEVEVRHYYMPAAAGTGTFLDSDDYETITVKKSTVPPKADFALDVSGDSMMPNYKNGQMVWVEETNVLYEGEIGIFIVDDSAFIKMYTEEMPNDDEIENYTSSDGVVHPKIVLVSLNKKYNPIHVSPFQTLHVVGRVLS